MVHLFQWGDIDDLLACARLGDLAITSSEEGPGSCLSRIKLHAEDGAGDIEYYADDALRVLMFDCAFREGRTFHVHDGDWIRLNFSLDIYIDMAFGSQLSVQALQPSWRLVRMPPGETAIEVVSANSRLQWVTICCKPERLSHLAGIDADDLPFRLMGAPTADDDIIYRPFDLTPALKALTSNLIGGVRPRGGLGRAYVARKADELLILALDHLLNDHSIESLQVRLTERDLDAIQAARVILDENLADPPTMKVLSQRVGVNRNKLFYGFKRLFQLSVSEYVQGRKIELGRDLLATTDAPISDIAGLAGFRHQCNFSTAFKARYGLTPIAFRKQARFPSPLAGDHGLRGAVSKRS